MHFRRPTQQYGKPIQLQRNLKRLKEKARELYRRRDEIIKIAGFRKLKEMRNDNFIAWLQKVYEIKNKIQAIEAEFFEKKRLLAMSPPSFSQLKLSDVACVHGISQQKLGKRVMDLNDVISKLMVDAENVSAQMKNVEQRREQEAIHPTEIESEIIQAQTTESRTISMFEIEESETTVPDRGLDKMMKVMGKECEMPVDCAMPKILESIKSETIQIIGIWGRVGVGKTNILKALNDLPEINKMFDNVIWVTVSKDWCMTKVQRDIERQISLTMLKNDNEYVLSLRLFKLLKNRKFLLLLDDVCEQIDLSEMGIPKPTTDNGSKILLTTRVQEVLHIMERDIEIRIESLSEDGSWDLFCKNAGKVVNYSNIQPVARCVVEECGGHPLAINLMARALKEASDVRIWSDALYKLSSPPKFQREDVEELIVTVLKFSCARLEDEIVRKCFKHFALFHEIQKINTMLLIDSWIADGLIDTCVKGNNILKALINANLLESVDEGISVRMDAVIRNILVDIIIPIERGRQCLMLGGLGLTEPPKDEEWEKAKEIRLMDNELTMLPASPKCPILSTLFLQRNYKLEMIPQSFFEYMPSIQVLNLSGTKIKFFPESLFKLIGLQQLYLNYCEHIMVLPPEIGELKYLQVLDLEGTEIIELPIEIGKLTHLTCLQVSFYGYINHGKKIKQSKTMIPHGKISTFSNLEELSINVNPDDDRWDGSVEAIIKEVSTLGKLQTLNFYFPDVELLKVVIRNSSFFKSSQLLHFRFIVGPHLKRIVTRLPHDVESELEQSSRRLIYVNGEGIISQEIREVLENTTAFYLDRHMSVKRLSEFGIKNMKQLEICIMGECNEIQTIIDREDVEEGFVLGSLRYLYIHYMKNLRSIWDGPVVEGSLVNLKSLTLSTCPQLTTIFSLSMIGQLSSLEELRIEDCPAINSIISVGNVTESLHVEKLNREKKSLSTLSGEPSVEVGVDYEQQQKHFCTYSPFLPSLKRLLLHYLPEMVNISDGFYYIGPKLEWMSFYNCPNLMILPIRKVSHYNLRVIRGERDWWDALKWESGRSDYFDRIFVPN
ncbi:hypothetical protein HHK36_030322 [Tetracentron sinense]|uniref:NB-ARC domain-containing protein n=1 Tax=Tetracentron sinense TaxID=13715 RepID=A0A834YBX4_TETSI|nr:hypothetical protein HHK36_030322 [Tetracentron sinense]